MRRILVFPCGSEIGLEIHRSVQFSTHFHLVGGSSVDDHGRFTYADYVDGLPFHTHADFPARLRAVIRDQAIDAVYPAMDAVAETLQALQPELGCRVIGSDLRATATCASKSATYELLRGAVPVPAVFRSLAEVSTFPVFLKPDRGYGTRNCRRADHRAAAEAFLSDHPPGSMLVLEYLPGPEWTVDCFSDRHGALRFHAVRKRNRIANGISVNTTPCSDFAAEFATWAHAINARLRPRGAWFFQAKQDAHGRPKLLEVAARLGGSSGVFRCLGVNFALLSLFDAFDHDVAIAPNHHPIELDRALANRYRTSLQYAHVFVDLDDCLIVRNRVNTQLVAFLYQALADGKGLTLLTRHRRDLPATLATHRLTGLFDRVIHLTDSQPKSDFVDRRDAIFIDDSFAERHDVATRVGIPVLSPDMVEALL